MVRHFSLAVLSAAVLAACSTTRPPAPVVDRSAAPAAREPVTVLPSPVLAPAPPVTPPSPAPVAMPPAVAGPFPDVHTVRAGETLYSIARLYNLSPRELAQINGLPPEAVLRAGQTLRLTTRPNVTPPVIVATPLPPAAPAAAAPPAAPAVPPGEVKREPKAVKIPYSDEAYARVRGAQTPGRPAAAPVPAGAVAAATVPSTVPPAAVAASPAPVASTPVAAASPTAAAPGAPAASAEVDSVTWSWPTNGRVTKKFSENAVLRGLTLEGRLGAPVYAAANGRVIYAGEGLRGYGRVIIVRHNDQYTSVYGHNSVLHVKEGDTVRRGQKIAEMGSTETDSPKLYFEVRRGGKAIDPEKLLPAR